MILKILGALRLHEVFQTVGVQVYEIYGVRILVRKAPEFIVKVGSGPIAAVIQCNRYTCGSKTTDLRAYGLANTRLGGDVPANIDAKGSPRHIDHVQPRGRGDDELIHPSIAFTAKR